MSCARLQIGCAHTRKVSTSENFSLLLISDTIGFAHGDMVMLSRVTKIKQPATTPNTL